jgi:nucleotide-binding universal stress UspA family protein
MIPAMSLPIELPEEHTMNIVLAVDGGAQQASAVALAAALARATDAKLTVATVYPWSRWSERLGNAYELAMREDAEGILAQASDQLGEPAPEQRAIGDESVPRALQTLCEELRADLLVIGASHRGPVGRALLGGVGDRVVHGSPCPVAVAPRDFGAPADPVTSIGVGVDGSDESHAALEWATTFAESVGARLVIVDVVEPIVVATAAGGVAYPYEQIHDEQRAACQEELDRARAIVGDRVEATTRLLEGPAVTRLAEAAADVDVFVVGSRGYGPLRALMLGATGRALLHASPSPLVTVPRPHADALADGRPAGAAAMTV